MLVDESLEFPVIRNILVADGVGEWRRHRIARLPGLDRAVIDRETEEVYAGRLVGRVDVCTALGQTNLRISFDVPVDNHGDLPGRTGGFRRLPHGRWGGFSSP